MRYEVEQKFHAADLDVVAARLAALGAAWAGERDDRDLYFTHPCRDFAQTDEAVRLRSVGDGNWITYKGPKLDPLTKTRREIELPLAPGELAASEWCELMEALGFRPVAEVRKHRRRAVIAWEGWTVDATLDEVEEVGRYVELELVVAPEQLELAKAAIASLAQALDLAENERRSYLELLLSARAGDRGPSEPPSEPPSPAGP